MSIRSERPGALLLGSDHKALGVARSLGRRGIPAVVIDNVPRSAWFSRYVRKRFRWLESMEKDSFISYLIELGRKYDLEHWVLLPMQDEAVDLIARHTCELAKVFRLATQDWPVLKWAGDKRLTHQLARQTGVPYPQTWYPRSVDELNVLDIAYPAIVKPAISAHLHTVIRLKALPACDLGGLRSQYERAASILPTDEIMIQEIIPGDGLQQFSVAAYCKLGRVVMCMSARRRRQFPIDYGLGSSFVEAVEVPELFELADKVLAFMGVTGMAEVEFKRDLRDGLYKLLDVNVRPWGWHTLCAACGLDFPYIQYCDIMGMEPTPLVPRYGPKWIRLAIDIPAGLQEMRACMTTPWAYLSSLRGRLHFSVLDWRDPLPAVGDIGSVAVRAVQHARQQHALQRKAQA